MYENKILPKFEKKNTFILPMKTPKNRNQKLLIISPQFFFSTGPTVQTSPQFIFHIKNMSQASSVYWSVFLTNAWNLIFFGQITLGVFTNYVDKFLPFIDHIPPCVDIIYFMNVDKYWYFWTTYPPLRVNVVCELPLVLNGSLICNPRKNSTTAPGSK